MASPHGKSLVRTALITAPLIGAAMATPLFIVSNLEFLYFWVMISAVTMLVTISWTLNILVLKFRQKFGRFPWLQIFMVSGAMILVSVAMERIIQPELPEELNRLPLVRFVNVLVVNTIIYVIIDLRVLSESRAKLAEENAQLRFRNLETQYLLLREQVNPHFLFNALGTAKSLVRRDQALAENYIIRLSDFLRASLENAPDLVLVRDELKLVRNYVELQQMRFRDALRFEISLDEAMMAKELPFFALLTLVENAVKHNSMSAENPLLITLNAAEGWIVVKNNHQTKSPREAKSGSGLNNLRERCRMLGYGQVEVNPSANFFEVRIKPGKNS